MIADVWTKRDFFAVGFMLAAVALIGLGVLVHVPALMIAGVVVGAIGAWSLWSSGASFAAPAGRPDPIAGCRRGVLR